MINLNINGKPIEVLEGTTVLNAARQAGITIPTLCDHKELTPYGGCRLCLVEVEGARTLQPSCTLPATNGMVVKTDTTKTKAAREFILTLIFSERNHFCPYCQVSGGDCELQNSAYHEGMTHWPIQPNWKPYPVDASHPYIIIENNRCILCRRCVRACDEIAGNFTLAFEERGPLSLLVADLGVPLGVSSCVSCGSCVQVCPTGAIIDRPSAYKGREIDVEKTTTICVGCSLGCRMEVLTRNNRLVRIEGDWNADVNGGALCKIGRFLPVEDLRERVQTPLIRKDGILKITSWEEALKFVGEKLKPFIGKKENKLAAGASSKLSAEALHAFNQLFYKGLNGRMVASLDGDSTAASSKLTAELGKPFEGKLSDLKTADCVICLGVDPTKQHEVASFFFKRNIPAGTKVIVVDPGENQMDLWADLTIKSKKLTDPTLIKDISKAAEGAKKVCILFGRELSPEMLKEVLKFCESIGAKMIGLKGGANSMTAAQYGLDKVYEPKDAEVAVIALADEEPSQQLITALQSVPFKIVLASYKSTLTENADVVLPTQLWTEQSGSYLNMEGKLQSSHAALKASGDSKAELETLQKLAVTLGLKLDEEWKKTLTQRTSSVTIEL